jgi:hypothetical protein
VTDRNQLAIGIFILALLGLALLCMLSACSWSPETRAEESVYQSLNAIDYTQTMRIAQSGHRWQESSSAEWIGHYPSCRSVDGLFAAQAIGHAGVTELLERWRSPAWLKRTWQGVGIAVEGRSVTANWSAGL